jgi:F-type H+-transporting ATPase subunit delta
VLERQVDPEILGGLVARVGDRLIDGSTRTRLLALRRQLGGETAS